MEYDWTLMKPVLDKLGVEITPGCCVIYGHAMGRCAGLRVGKVLSVSDRKVEHWGEVVAKIRVRGINDDWEHKGLEPCRAGTLQFPKRILVVEVDSLSEGFRKIWESL